MWNLLSSRVTTKTYIRSPCIRRWPGGGFQADVVKILRQATRCASLLAGCNGNSGLSEAEAPGSKKSGGVQSMAPLLLLLFDGSGGVGGAGGSGGGNNDARKR